MRVKRGNFIEFHHFLAANQLTKKYIGISKIKLTRLISNLCPNPAVQNQRRDGITGVRPSRSKITTWKPGSVWKLKCSIEKNVSKQLLNISCSWHHINNLFSLINEYCFAKFVSQWCFERHFDAPFRFRKVWMTSIQKHLQINKYFNRKNRELMLRTR